MVKGLYTAYTGMRNEQRRLDVISNNFANANTTGYKKMGVTSQAFDEHLAVRIDDKADAYLYKGIGDVSLGVKIGETYTDFSAGSFKETGGTYDVALEGSGFFAIQTTNKAGETTIRYTRDGSFTVTREGVLVTHDGDLVLGPNNQRIVIPGADTAQVTIDSLGNIYANDVQVGSFQLVDFENTDALELYGENMFTALPEAGMVASQALTRQGYLEQSNVNVVNEMVSLITINRAYETNQKMIQTIDSSLEKSVNEIGKV